MSNVEKLRAAYRTWHDTRGQNSDAWFDLFTDDVTIRSLADGAPGMEFSALRRGKADVGRYFADLAADWEMLFYHAQEFVAEGERVVMIGRCGWRHKKTGKEVETPVFAYWNFREGKVAEYFEFYDTAKAFAATQPG